MLTSHGHTGVWSGGEEIVLSRLTRSLSLIQNRPATLLLYGGLVASEEGRGQVDLVGIDYLFFTTKNKTKQNKTRQKKRREEKRREEKRRKEKKKRKEKKTKIVHHGLLRQSSEPEATLITHLPLQCKLSQRRCNLLRSRVDHLYRYFVYRWVSLSHQQ